MGPTPRAGLWWQAARPRTLSAAIAPVLVGAGLAAGDDVFRGDALLAALGGAVAIQVAANFANDASDARRGADPDDRVGPPRMVSTGQITARQMWIGVWSAIGIASLCGVYLIVIAGWIVAIIGVASVLAMLSYVGGPAPYGYRALGELSVFIFFGIVATVGSRYVHGQSAPANAWLLAIPVGMLAVAILVANNLRDIDTDTQAGKRTLAVVIGRSRTSRLYGTLVLGAPIVIGLFAGFSITPQLTGLAAMVALPFAVVLANAVRRKPSGSTLIGVLIGTARLQLVVGALVAAGAAFGML